MMDDYQINFTLRWRALKKNDALSGGTLLFHTPEKAAEQMWEMVRSRKYNGLNLKLVELSSSDGFHTDNLLNMDYDELEHECERLEQHASAYLFTEIYD